MNQELKQETKKIFRIMITLANQIIDGTLPTDIDMFSYLKMKYHLTLFEIRWLVFVLDILMKANIQFLTKYQKELDEKMKLS